VQVLDQAREGGVERRDLASATGKVLGVVVPFLVGDRDERCPHLDQPTRQEQALTDPGPAVAVARLRVLAREVELLPRPRAGDHLES
jgi:hypothetical protein